MNENIEQDQKPSACSFQAKIKAYESLDSQLAVVLDRSQFSPQNSFHFSDIGKIGKSNVVDVRISKQGTILHLLEKSSYQHKIGEIVSCEVDYQRRYDLMQQITAQALLSYSFQKIYGVKTTAATIGKISSAIVLDTNYLNEIIISAVETCTNKLIELGYKIMLNNPQEDICCNSVFEIKEKEKTLIITSQTNLFCANTIELGIVKILTEEKIGTSSKVTFVSGRRAYVDYSRKQKLLEETAKHLQTNENEIPISVQKQLEENNFLRKELEALKSKIYSSESIG